MDTQIKQATLENVKEISEILRVLVGSKQRWSKKSISSEMQIEYKNYYLILNKNRPIGAIVLDFNNGNCQLEAIAVKEKQNGNGSKLLTFAEELALQKGCQQIWCYSLLPYNAKVFYEKNGWIEAERDKYGRKKDIRIKFQKQLK